ncbi:hypothetical protein LELG_02769 [Lodderomyces elongisporus NRRL YB-4239]|uniref:Zn(2)-C6 fungal-type domain-containing protein n=1 Tax=Lodderomyces elongisporus (strain ATCC 11503 / CBS 2605 / JCM 1781 / NBRC 1676 / NRRL YB-4239) TaxID=379508 RepID=A5DZI2_LODEL|nr:hypothetical protein LELG_02769 [Lodderomyces elongisporus NRRL YB-4239]
MYQNPEPNQQHDEFTIPGQNSHTDANPNPDLVTNTNSVTHKTRNRASLLCFPCRRRKVKCSRGKPCDTCQKKGIVDQCQYDERLNKKQKRKSLKKEGISAELDRKRTKTLVETLPITSISGASYEGEVATKIEDNFLESTPRERSPDVCVLIGKSQLEALQAKVKAYELQFKEQLVKPQGNNNKVIHLQSAKPADLVYNKSINTYRHVIFSAHEESRPGYVPLENVTTDTVLEYSTDMSVTSELRLSELSRPERSLLGINPYLRSDETIELQSEKSHYNDLNKPKMFSPLSWSYLLRISPTMRALRSYASEQKELENIKRASIGITYDPLRKLMLPKDARIKSTLLMDGENLSIFEAKTEENQNETIGEGEKERKSGDTTAVTKKANTTPSTTAPSSSSSSSSSFLSSPPPPPPPLADAATTTPFKDVQNPSGKLNVTTFALGLSVQTGAKERESNLIEQIQSVIPKKRVIWLLFKRFLKLLYPMMPFIIESQFVSAIENIIGPELYQEVKPQIRISSRIDFANLGILLVILRLSYLSLFHNRGFHNEKVLTDPAPTGEVAEKKYLLLNPVNIDTADIALACYHHLEKLGQVCIPTLQCAIYLRLYRTYAPEEGDGRDGGDSHIKTCNLIAMSYMLGLNREPDKVTVSKDEKLKNLYRKMWYFMVSAEQSLTCAYGWPMLIRKESYDTKRPYYTEQNSNLENKEIDKTCYFYFAFITALIRGPVRMLTQLYLDVEGKVKVMELTNHLNHLEQGVKLLLGNLSNYMSALEEKELGYRTSKMMKVQALLKMNAFLMINYRYLCNHYEKSNKDLCFFYLRKQFELAFLEDLPYSFALITKSQEIFGEGADLFINPSIIQIIVKISDLCLTAIVVSNVSLLRLSNDENATTNKTKVQHDPDFQKLLDETSTLITLMEKSCRVCLAALSMLSSRYYLAWEAVKTQNYYLQIATSPKFYKAKHKEAVNFPTPNYRRLQQLNNIASSGLEILQKLVFTYCEEVDLPGIFKMGDPARENHRNNNKSTCLLTGTEQRQQFPTSSERIEKTGKTGKARETGEARETKETSKTERTRETKETSKTERTRETEKFGKTEKLSTVSSQTIETNSGETVDEVSPLSGTDPKGLFFAGFEDMTFDNSAEIDSIWLQMLSLKSNNLNGFLEQGYNRRDMSNPYHLRLNSQVSLIGNYNIPTDGINYASSSQMYPMSANGVQSAHLQTQSQSIEGEPRRQMQLPFPSLNLFQPPQQFSPLLQNQSQSQTQSQSQFHSHSQFQPRSQSHLAHQPKPQPQPHPSTRHQPQSQPQPPDLNQAGPSHPYSYPPPNIFNYTDLFEDLPLEKLFDL